MARLFKADHGRRIELDGVGPAARPVDIDQAQTGFASLKTLRIYHFEPPAVINGHAEEDEVFIVVLQGEIELQMRSEHWSSNEQRFTLEAAGKPGSVACAAYLPPHAEYSLTPRSGADVAYVRALPTEARAPAVFSTVPRRSGKGSQLLLDPEAYAQRLRLQLWYAEASEQATELASASHSAMSETLVHVRSTRTRAVTVEANGLSGTMLDSWDTVGLSAGEPASLRLAARASALSLIVSAS
ncbi:MAG: 5-deoxy-glucuronate isomerase [Nibricoccus sp.]